EDLAAFAHAELSRTNRGILICNPIPPEHQVNPRDWHTWLTAATTEADRQKVKGRALTPFLLDQLHRLSSGQTLRANLALIKSNAALAADLARVIAPMSR